MIRAALVGAVLAVIGWFLLAFMYGAMGGRHATFDERMAHGVEWSAVMALAVSPILIIVGTVALTELAVRLLSEWPTRRARDF